MRLSNSAGKVVAVLSLCSMLVSYVPPAMAEEVSGEVPTPVVETTADPVIEAPSSEVIPIVESNSTLKQESSELNQVDLLPENPTENGILEIDQQLEALQEQLVNEEPQDQVSAMSASTSPVNEVFDSVGYALSEIDKNTGALIHSFPIVVPPGRNGLQPDLKISYNSQAAGEGSIFGSNWSISIPYIQRLGRYGVDQLYSTTTPTYFISTLDGELATSTASSTQYLPRIEGGNFNKYSFANNRWTMIDKAGSVYKFGSGTSTRQDDSADSSRAYKWMLEEVRDTNNNYIKYVYAKETGEIYPSSVIYTGNGTTDGIFQVDFVREARADVTTSTITGFSVASKSRVSRIDVKIGGSLVRQYSLGYTPSDNGVRSLLSTIAESGKDEVGNTVTVPTTTFDYQTQSPGWTSNATWNPPIEFTESNYHDKGFRIADVNGDSLPDLLWSYDFTPNSYTAYINNGHGWTADSSWNPPVTFVTQSYDDKGYKVLDVNGDGLVDIIRGIDGAPASYEAYINNGHGWTADSSWNPPVTFTESNYHDKGYKIVDVNGDGLPDLLWSYEFTPNNYTAYINNGHGWTADSSWNPPVTFVTQAFQDKGYEVLDVNGDGLSDIIRGVDGAPASYEAYINNGHGWTADSSWNPPVTFTESNFNDKGFKFTDVNGDDLPDFFWSFEFSPPPSSYLAYINNGHGWTADSSWNPPVTFVSQIFQEKGYKITDINGNGLPDIIRGVDSGNYEAYVNNGGVKTLLSKITHPQGGTTSYNYLPISQYTNQSNGLVNSSTRLLYTIANKIVSDGFGTIATTTYKYEGAKDYFSGPREKKFAGFEVVTETDPVGNITKTYFHQGNSSDSARGEYSDDYFKIGKPYRIEKYDTSSNLFEKTINKWDRVNTSGTNAGFVNLVQSVVSTYDGDASHKDKAESYVFSTSTGNLLQNIQYGEVSGSDDGTFSDTGTDKITMDLTYASSSNSNVKNAVRGVITTDNAGTKIKESRFYYDALALGSVSKGNRTREDGWRVSSTYINSQKTYNATYGTVATETDPRGKVTSYAYDTFNLYPITVTNPLSQISRYTYDYSLGKSKQVTDGNGLITQTVYDGLDRVLQKKQPDLTTSSTLVTAVAYTYTDTPGAVSVQETKYLTPTSTVDSYAYFDGLNRVIQKRKSAEGTYQVSDSQYDKRGLLQKESLPYFSSGASKTSATTTSALYTNYSYDPLQRIKTASNVLGTTTSTYADWKVTLTDPNSKQKDLTYDAFQRLIQVDEYNTTSTYKTRYTYNGRGDLTQLRDALGNVRNFTYDGLSRRLTAQDLHTPADATFGTWTYTYDDASNMLTAVDPKAQTIRYSYDNINRVLTEDFASTSGTEVGYLYDVCSFGIGSLCSVTSTASVTSTLQYNPLKLVSQETKMIGGTNYQTSYTYDQQGNQLLIVQPDNSQVKYDYNAGGLVEKVWKKETSDPSFVQVVKNFDYSPADSVALISFANGATTTNTFDTNKLYRLTQKLSTIPGGTKAQDIGYAYDAVGNITTLTDNSQTNAKKTVTYTYDDLYRLKSASASDTPGAIPGYTRTYNYNAIGNILHASDLGSYGYASGTTLYTNPQGVISVASSTLAYDRNGNLMSIIGAASTSSVSGWQVNGGTWQRKRTITIDKTKVSGTGNLFSFPVVFSHANAEFKSVPNGGYVASSTGADIFFTSSDGTTKLNHELENYSSSTGSITAWINVPVVATSTDTVLYMYYGNASSTSQQNKTGVWDSYSRGVWHLDNQFLDSTSNTNNGTNSGSTDTPGKIGNARNFNGVNQRITVPNSGTLQPASGLTVSTWLKRNGLQNDWTKILWYGQAWSAPWGPYGFQFNGSSDSDTQFHLASTSTDYSVPAITQIATSTWFHLAGTYDGSVMRYYINGALQSTHNPGIQIGNYDGTNGLAMADIYQGTQILNGSLDEVHIDGIARSSDWIATTYNNQNATNTFMTLGASQSNQGITSSLSNAGYIWDYQNRLIQATSTNATSTFVYDQAGTRVKVTAQYATSTVTTIYPSKFYNITGATSTKHIFANGQLIATITGSGATSSIRTILTDHLSGSNVVLTSSGAIDELADYYPFGDIRLDEKVSSFTEQRKFIGQEYDVDTGLSYLNARYYNGKAGRFTSQDKLFIQMGDPGLMAGTSGDKKMMEKLLADPQQLNSYSYARNNPIVNRDSSGNVVETIADIGFTAYDAGNTLYKGGQFVGAVFSGNLQKASDASNAFLGSFVDLGVDAGATLVPFLPAGLTKVDDAARAVKQFDAVAQQQKMLKGIENSKVVNVIKDVFRTSDSLPGGTMGALRNEIMTGKETKGVFHDLKAQNTINRITNIFKSQILNSTETGRLKGISNSLESLRKSIKR